MVAHFAVIGAGVYGSAVAAALAEEGAQVTVIDRGSPGRGTSGATFSWTNSCGKQPRAYHDLSVGGMEAHRKFSAEFDGADWYHEHGNLEWASTADAKEKLSRKVQGLVDYGYPVEWLTKEQVLRLEPDMAPERVPDDGVAFYGTEGWIEPTRMIGFLLLKAKSMGARVIDNDHVEAIDLRGSRVEAVRLASGETLRVDGVVNCAGPRAAGVAEMAGLSLPMRNTRGVLVYTSPTAVAVRRVIHAPDIHLRPDGAGRVLLHTEELDSAVVSDPEAAVTIDADAERTVLAASRDLYPGMQGVSVESVRVGERPIPHDGLPVLGRSLAVENFFFAVSHSGATLSLHAGGLVAAEALGRPQDESLAAFRHERLAA
jgi:glycine/D-amino acid oxidase-like deaminating enzyme